jgi:tellurite resistance protein TehA-like permease
MTAGTQTSREYFRTLNILFFALVAGQFFFAIIIIFLNLTGIENEQGKDIKQILLLLVPILIVGSIYASQMVFKSKLSLIKNKTLLKEKMFEYRSACIIRWAILELPGFLSLVICFWTGDLLFLGMTAIVIAYFITIRPGVEKAIIENQ